ncbi:hypothetical protein NPX13_g9019 [Xylaria arbuscula]|uniref:Uncharacterized protein n=1 Tax=Xylaria arbuscula TaxID=114810 RepID=A0A9W8THW1_9PEZI|nr:hypothetical protein NPX13_g9019 [Xylaria arbuscula]
MGNLDICQIFFDSHESAGSDVTSTFSPLHFACFNAHLEVVRFLITKGANVNAVANYRHFHERKEAFRILKFLHDIEDATPFDLLLCQLGWVKDQLVASCAILLINAGAKPNECAAALDNTQRGGVLLSKILNAEINPHESNSNGYTALQEVSQKEWQVEPWRESPDAIGKSPRDVVKLLLENSVTLSGNGIADAILLQDWDLVALLLEYGGDLSSTDKFGTTALEAAIRSKHVPSITRLFDITPSAYDAGSLCVAIETQQSSTVQKLLLNRRNQSVTHELEVTAIGRAAQFGHIDLLRSLLQYPPFEKAGPMPILELRPGRGPTSKMRFKVLMAFRDYPYRPYGPHLWGSPLALISTQNDNKAFEVCSMLLKNGFKPDRLTWAVAADSNNTAFVQFLLNNGQRYEKDNEHDNNQPDIQNPLVAAIERENKELAGLLLEAGFDVNDFRSSETFDTSPLQLAVQLGNFGLVRFLTEANADVNSPPAEKAGATALQMAAIRGHLGIAKYLLDLGADVNARGARYSGRTALEGAAEWGRLDILELLLSSGACTTGSGRRSAVRAVAFSLKERHYTVADFLKESLGLSEEELEEEEEDDEEEDEEEEW